MIIIPRCMTTCHSLFAYCPQGSSWVDCSGRNLPFPSKCSNYTKWGILHSAMLDFVNYIFCDNESGRLFCEHFATFMWQANYRHCIVPYGYAFHLSVGRLILRCLRPPMRAENGFRSTKGKRQTLYRCLLLVTCDINLWIDSHSLKIFAQTNDATK